MRLYVYLILCSVYIVKPFRILTVLPTATRSHYAPMRRIITELVKRGHEVVSISPFEEKDAPRNLMWIEIEVDSLIEAVPEFKHSLNVELSFFKGQERLWRGMDKYVRHIVKLPKLKNYIENDNSDFDLVLAEEFFQPVFFVFAYKYKAPLALISTFGPGHFINEYMGNPLELSYVPHEFVELFGNLNFFQKIWNAICSIYDIIGRKIYLYGQNELAREVFHNVKDIPSLYDLERNASLIFLNSHFSTTTVRPFLPNIVEIGGVHMTDVQPLSQELKMILDEAQDGAVLFSFGSVLELALQSDDFVERVFYTLGKLKQRVLVKWNSDKKMPVAHKNIYLFRWLPQNDILAHPNTALFITHGGLLSSQETIFHGVPIICIPFYSDQPLNCERSVQMGYGIHIKRDNILNSNVLDRSIEDILTNPAFKNNAQELSRRFRDRPNAAIDTAIYWIEYCIRHKGMKHASGPRRNLYWFQYYFLDVFLFLSMILWCLLKVVKFLLVWPKRTDKLKLN